MTGNPLVLECHNLGKRFGGLEAVSKIELRIAPGERRAIIGPNGAGKTTLFRLISGEFPVTSGTIRLFQHDVTHMACHRRTHLGLGRTFQITNLFPTLTVLDNLVIAAMGQRGMKFSLLRPLSTYRDLYRQAEEVLENVGMIDKQYTLIRNLSHGEQRQIEISLALISKPRVLLLDEPTAGLSPAESAMMTGILKNLDSTMTILIIEH
jgi:branched-chain amino acid transport system ATP-binding protein